jgi:hypothetical protein
VRPQSEFSFFGWNSDFSQYGHRGRWAAVVFVALETNTIVVDFRFQSGKVGVCESGHQEWKDREVGCKKGHKEKYSPALSALPEPCKRRRQQNRADERR